MTRRAKALTWIVCALVVAVAACLFAFIHFGTAAGLIVLVGGLVCGAVGGAIGWVAQRRGV